MIKFDPTSSITNGEALFNAVQYLSNFEQVARNGIMYATFAAGAYNIAVKKEVVTGVTLLAAGGLIAHDNAANLKKMTCDVKTHLKQAQESLTAVENIKAENELEYKKIDENLNNIAIIGENIQSQLNKFKEENQTELKEFEKEFDELNQLGEKAEQCGQIAESKFNRIKSEIEESCKHIDEALSKLLKAKNKLEEETGETNDTNQQMSIVNTWQDEQEKILESVNSVKDTLNNVLTNTTEGITALKEMSEINTLITTKQLELVNKIKEKAANRVALVEDVQEKVEDIQKKGEETKKIVKEIRYNVEIEDKLISGTQELINKSLNALESLHQKVRSIISVLMFVSSRYLGMGLVGGLGFAAVGYYGYQYYGALSKKVQEAFFGKIEVKDFVPFQGAQDLVSIAYGERVGGLLNATSTPSFSKDFVKAKKIVTGQLKIKVGNKELTCDFDLNRENGALSVLDSYKIATAIKDACNKNLMTEEQKTELTNALSAPLNKQEGNETYFVKPSYFESIKTSE